MVRPLPSSSVHLLSYSRRFSTPGLLIKIGSLCAPRTRMSGVPWLHVHFSTSSSSRLLNRARLLECDVHHHETANERVLQSVPQAPG